MRVIALEPAAATAAAATAAGDRAPARVARWVPVYLVACTALVPLAVPAGPAQTSLGDALNLVAMIAFALALRHRARPLRLPLLFPALLVASGSLLAATEAVSLRAVALTLAQDLYLYLWFVMLVGLMDDRGPLLPVRRAWLWTADVVALAGLLLLPRGPAAGLLAPGGPRAAATFYGPNMFADYLVLSVFNLLGLHGQVPARWLAPSLALLTTALFATQSNGGWISLCAGLSVAAIVWTATGGVARARIAGALALLAGAALLAGGLLTERGGGSALRALEAHSFVGRVGHSTESRQAIWRSLGTELAREPLGIGPGNSAMREVPIGERERPDSFRSKEPHNDYLGYAVERGPLGLAGLLLALGAILVRVWGAGATLARRTGSVPQAELLRACLIGALVASSVHSLVIEKLHFRHVWLFLALAWAVTEEPA